MNYSGSNLKFLCTILDISQASIESVVNKRQQTISNWMNQRSTMDAEDLIKLVDYFGVSMEDFCLTDLSNGNLITEEYISRFQEKSNLNGNPKGNLLPQFYKKTGESHPPVDGGGALGDSSFWVLVNLIKEVSSKLDQINVRLDSRH